MIFILILQPVGCCFLSRERKSDLLGVAQGLILRAGGSLSESVLFSLFIPGPSAVPSPTRRRILTSTGEGTGLGDGTSESESHTLFSACAPYYSSPPDLGCLPSQVGLSQNLLLGPRGGSSALVHVENGSFRGEHCKWIKGRFDVLQA